MEFPPEILLLVLKKLEDIKSLVFFSSTCKKAREFVSTFQEDLVFLSEKEKTDVVDENWGNLPLVFMKFKGEKFFYYKGEKMLFSIPFLFSGKIHGELKVEGKLGSCLSCFYSFGEKNGKIGKTFESMYDYTVSTNGQYENGKKSGVWVHKNGFDYGSKKLVWFANGRKEKEIVSNQEGQSSKKVYSKRKKRIFTFSKVQNNLYAYSFVKKKKTRKYMYKKEQRVGLFSEFYYCWTKSKRNGTVIDSKTIEFDQGAHITESDSVFGKEITEIKKELDGYFS